MPGQGALVESLSQNPPGEQEESHTGKTQQETIFYRAQDGPADPLVVSPGIALGDHGQQHDGDGAGERVGKKDHGESHAGQYAVHAESRGGVVAVTAQPGGNGYGFHALQQIEYDPVGGQGDHHTQQLPVAEGGRRMSGCGDGGLAETVIPGGRQSRQHGAAFPYGQAQHRHIDGRGLPLGQYGGGEQIDAGHPAALLQQLCACGDPRFFYTVKIAVDTGMNGAQGNGGSQEPDHGGRSGFPEQIDRYEIAARKERRRAGKGQGNC